MADIDVSFIVVSYNTRELTRGCLRSIEEQSEGFRYEIILVDNASSDGSAEMVAADFANVRLVANNDNLGFAGANNQAFALATGRYVLLLNPDTEIVDNATLACVEFADERPDAGVIGCRVRLPDGEQQSTMFRYLRPAYLLINLFIPNRLIRRSRLLGRIRYVGIDQDQIQDVEVIAGCFMLVRREVLEQVGGMDGDFFMYGEEAEWCFRIRRAGWRNLYLPGPTILHYGAQSAKQSVEKMTVNMCRGQLLFIQKTQGALAAWVANLLMLIRDIPRVLVWLLVRWMPGRLGSEHSEQLRPAVTRLRIHLGGLYKPDWSGRA